MIPLAIAFTPNYIVPAATMLKSLLDSSADTFHIICLVTEEIPREMQEMLYKMGNGRLEMEYFPLKGRLDGYYTDARYSEAASFRLLLPELLPDYEKILYLDCDIVVRQDMGALYRNTDLEDNYLAAVYEAPIEGQADRIRALGCIPGQYFNSGMLLMNLKQMREEKVSTRLLKACEKDYMEFPDQDALNQVCQGRVLPISPVYNGIRSFFLPQYKRDFYAVYSTDLWEQVQREGNIHYTGGKPWNIFSVEFGQWWKVYFSLPKEIQTLMEFSGKIGFVSQLYKLGIGRLLDWGIMVYRKLK
ncbi:MAG: glycosyltransferase family 8 protein [Bacteroidales bacterium]|nr:glycosyltransferase family 8 protein [Bacteroidales bacterium]